MTDFKKMYGQDVMPPSDLVLDINIFEGLALIKFLEYIKTKYNLEDVDSNEVTVWQKTLEPRKIA